MTDDLDDADENERAEAAALAAALDGKASEREAPQDALATALLMRHGGARGELPEQRSEEILRELLRDTKSGQRTQQPQHARAQTAVPAGRRGQMRRLLPWGAALAAAAVLLLVWVRPWMQPEVQSVVATAPPPATAAPVPGAARTLPQASVELLSAQSALLRESLERERSGATAGGSAKSAVAERFERELRAYRAQLFRALQAQYPTKLGLLDRPARRTR